MKLVSLMFLIISASLSSGCVSTTRLESKGLLRVGMTKADLCQVQSTNGAMLDTHHVCGWSRRQEYFPEVRAELLSTVAGNGHFLFSNVSKKMGALSLGYGDGRLVGWYETRAEALEAVAKMSALQASARSEMTSVESAVRARQPNKNTVQTSRETITEDGMGRLRAFLDIFRKPVEFASEVALQGPLVRYANGDSYSGGVSQSLRNGSGAYNFSKAGVSLSGRWKRGQPSRRMEVVFEDGSKAKVKIEGSTIRVLEGICSDGSEPRGSSVGVCSNGILTGIGIHTHMSGFSANYFQQGEKTGLGIEETLRSGEGIEAEVFEGEWKNGRWLNGTAVTTSADGRKFQRSGSWRRSSRGYQLDGEGEVISGSGDLIRGNFLLGKVHGYAVIEENDVSYAVPESQAVSEMKRVAKGDWYVDSEFGITGVGQVSYIANGYPLVDYEGRFRGFYPHGKAKARWVFQEYIKEPDPNGVNTADGIWEDGRLVSGELLLNNGTLVVQKNSRQVSIQYPDGSQWVGDSVNRVWQGYGKYYSVTGDIVYDGTFSNGLLHGLGKHYSNGKIMSGSWYEGDRISENDLDYSLLGFVDSCKSRGFSFLTSEFEVCLKDAQKDKQAVDRRLAVLEAEIAKLEERESRIRLAEAMIMEMEAENRREQRREEAFDQMLGIIQGVVDWKVQRREQRYDSNLRNQIKDLNSQIRSLQNSKAAMRLIQQSYP